MSNKGYNELYDFIFKIKDKKFYLEFKKPKMSIDIKNIKEFSEVVNNSIEKGVDAVQIDLKNLDFIDTSGLGKLLAFSRKVKIILLNVDPKIKKIMDITNLSAFFNFI